MKSSLALEVPYSFLLHLGLVGLLTASACGPEGEANEASSSSFVFAQTSAGLATAPAPAATAACPGTRQVGLNPDDGHCPAPRDSRWQLIDIFPFAGAAAPELRRYCVYDWEGADEPVMDGLPHEGFPHPSAWLTPDCDVVATFGHPYSSNNASTFENAFLTQVQAISPLPPVAGAPTSVIVVDTAPDAGFPTGGAGRSGHGRAMGAIIRNLACPRPPAGGFCGAQIATSLAMPLRRDATGKRVSDFANGGYFGRFTDVARAIHTGLHRGLAVPGSAGIIANMSLGWAPRWGGAIPPGGWSHLPTPIRAVYSALKEFRCQGGLPIVSEGNDAGGPDRTLGAAFPAAWESEPAPGPAQCGPVGGGGVMPTAAFNPLVFKVGGVDGADLELSNARPGASSRFVAPAAHVTVSQPPDYRSNIYTGSSVSAAVTSAAAALVWSYLPWLDAQQVMEVVYDSGVELDEGACGTTNPCPTRRVSICRAVAEACSAGRHCAVPSCAVRPAFDNDRATGLDTSVPVATQRTMTSTVTFVPQQPCSRPVTGAEEEDVLIACPSTQFYTGYSAPYAGPQPEPNVCPSCVMANKKVSLGIDSEVTDTLTDPILIVVKSSGVEEAYFIDNVGALTGGDTVEVNMNNLDPDGVVKAAIEFTTDGGFATHDELTVE